MSEREKNIKKRQGYLISVGLILLSIAVLLWWENPLDETDAKSVINDICNAFTVPGVIFSGISLLSYMAKLGAYDSFGYTFSNFSLHNLWFKKQPKKYKSFYDYKVAKDEKGRRWWKEGLFVGLASLAISAVLLIVYFIL